MTNEATRSLSIGRPIVVRNLFGQEKKGLEERSSLSLGTMGKARLLGLGLGEERRVI